VEIGGPAFEYMALERWHIAYALHKKALKNRSKVAYHSSRIGLKKFRYIVELFLPALYREWAADLKEMQDLLGEVHDLDVLWDMALKSGIVVDPTCAHAGRQKSRGNVNSASLDTDRRWSARHPYGSVASGATFRETARAGALGKVQDLGVVV